MGLGIIVEGRWIRHFTVKCKICPCNIILRFLRKRKFEEKVMFEPGYSFEYYNKNDGVQLGNDGFSEKNKCMSGKDKK